MIYNMSLPFQFQFFGLYNLGCDFSECSWKGLPENTNTGCTPIQLFCIYTPNYKEQKIETEKAKTYYISFLSLKSSDFKYVISKIVEVSPWNPPATQHS